MDYFAYSISSPVLQMRPSLKRTRHEEPVQVGAMHTRVELFVFRCIVALLTAAHTVALDHAVIHKDP